VIPESPAARAGIAPGSKIVAIDSRAVGDDVGADLESALRAAQSGSSLHLLIRGGNVYRDFAIDYHGGPRYPHLERIPGTPDLLTVVAAPRRQG
jgi:predicted metalloprotease with PDZ domain